MTVQVSYCPECDSTDIEEVSYASRVPYGDAEISVPDRRFSVCNSCQLEFVDAKQNRQNDMAVNNARRKNDNMLPTWEVRRIRESLGLNQEQAASLFGGGRNAFSKYENGAVTQAASMDRLLRVAERHPHIVRDLEEIVGANGTPLKGVFEAYKTAALMSVKLKPMPAANMSSVHGKMASGSSEQWV